jgi:hypothetical protein
LRTSALAAGIAVLNQAEHPLRIHLRLLETQIGYARDGLCDDALPPVHPNTLTLLHRLLQDPVAARVLTTMEEVEHLPPRLLGYLSKALREQWPTLDDELRELLAVMLADLAQQLLMRACAPEKRDLG